MRHTFWEAALRGQHTPPQPTGADASRHCGPAKFLASNLPCLRHTARYGLSGYRTSHNAGDRPAFSGIRGSGHRHSGIRLIPGGAEM
jgi:hypothetical protein